MPEPRTLTPRQEVRYLAWIVKRIERLSPAGQRWLRSYLGWGDPDA